MTHFPVSRRQALKTSACGFGNLALAGLLGNQAGAALPNPLSARRTHVAPRAKRVIFLFMQGGPSQVDSFDYKPVLDRRHGETLAFDDARVVANTGKLGSSQLLKKPLWKFRRYGDCGQIGRAHV